MEVEFEKVSIDDIRQFLNRKIRKYEHKLTHANSRVTFTKYRNELAVMRSMLFYLDIRFKALEDAKGKVQSWS
jgi:hypothetical protein